MNLTHLSLVRVLALVMLLTSGFASAQVSDTGGSWPDEAACQRKNYDEPTLEAWCIAIDTTRGNCVACHSFNVSPWPPGLPVAGNIAPPMVAMQGRFPDRDALYAVIADATTVNSRTIMPPYLRHGILDQRQIDLLVDFLLGL